MRFDRRGLVSVPVRYQLETIVTSFFQLSESAQHGDQVAHALGRRASRDAYTLVEGRGHVLEKDLSLKFWPNVGLSSSKRCLDRYGGREC